MRLSTVNKAIASEGLNLELVAGDGYFYFVGPGCESVNSASVYCYRLNHQGLDGWMCDARSVAREISENGYA